MNRSTEQMLRDLVAAVGPALDHPTWMNYTRPAHEALNAAQEHLNRIDGMDVAMAVADGQQVDDWHGVIGAAL